MKDSIREQRREKLLVQIKETEALKSYFKSDSYKAKRQNLQINKTREAISKVQTRKEDQQFFNNCRLLAKDLYGRETPRTYNTTEINQYIAATKVIERKLKKHCKLAISIDPGGALYFIKAHRRVMMTLLDLNYYRGKEIKSLSSKNRSPLRSAIKYLRKLYKDELEIIQGNINKSKYLGEQLINAFKELGLAPVDVTSFPNVDLTNKIKRILER